MSLFEKLGGEMPLRTILTDFYDALIDDVMIGYMFAGQDKARLIEREWEFTARLLGADIPYRGRTMAAAHRRHHITRGHFERRFKILEQVLVAHGVEPAIKDVWLSHTRQLAPVVMGRAFGRNDCDGDGPAEESDGPVVYRP